MGSCKKYLIRFNEESAENQKQELREYVICAHSNDGDFEVYPYGLSEKREQGITNLTGMRK